MAYIILGVLSFPFYFFFPDWFADRRSWETDDEIRHDGALAFEVRHPTCHFLHHPRLFPPPSHLFYLLTSLPQGARENADDEKAYPVPKSFTVAKEGEHADAPAAPAEKASGSGSDSDEVVVKPPPVQSV